MPRPEDRRVRPDAPERKDISSALDSAIGAGKSAIPKIGAQQISRFMESQSDIAGDVRILDLRGTGEVGASSGTAIFTASYRTAHETVTRDLVLRHAPGTEKRIFAEYDLTRQFRVQRALQNSAVPVAKPLWMDVDGEYLGVPGFIMTCEKGSTPHAAAFLRGPLAEASPEARRQMLGEVMKALVAIHQTDLEATGLQDFVLNAPGDTPWQRRVNWYHQTWEWLDLPEYQQLTPVHRWLIESAPEGPAELIHGDSTFQNYLFCDNRLTSVLDWELSSVGHAESDLALQQVSNELFAPPPGSDRPRPPTESELLELYAEAGGRPLSNFDYYKKFSAYMILVSVYALQRNLAVEARGSVEPLMRGLWAYLK